MSAKTRPQSMDIANGFKLMYIAQAQGRKVVLGLNSKKDLVILDQSDLKAKMAVVHLFDSLTDFRSPDSFAQKLLKGDAQHLIQIRDIVKFWKERAENEEVQCGCFVFGTSDARTQAESIDGAVKGVIKQRDLKEIRQAEKKERNEIANNIKEEYRRFYV